MSPVVANPAVAATLLRSPAWLLATEADGGGEDGLVVDSFGDGLLGELGTTLLVLAVGGVITYALHHLTMQLIRRGWESPYLTEANRLARWPARTTTTAIGLRAALELAPMGDPAHARIGTALVIVIIVAATVTGLRLVRAVQNAAIRTMDLATRDNLRARRRYTQVSVVGRVLNVGIVLVGMGAVLMTFDSARAFGAALLTSAGVAGVIAGVAARSTLGNLLAGIQIAFAEPIRIDDVVVVEGEFGWVEEINLTHVVVRVWDQRRLVLPPLTFVEQPFVNWTLHSSQIIGQVLVHLDPRADVPALREHFLGVVDRDERWDRDVATLQVVDTTERTMVVRAIMTAVDAPTLWDLRCEVREQLLAWLAAEHPDHLPRFVLEQPDLEQSDLGPGSPSGADRLR